MQPVSSLSTKLVLNEQNAVNMQSGYAFALKRQAVWFALRFK